jgi:hypothetical protein
MRRRKKPDLEFIWLGIVCINQNEDDLEAALNIGRQVKISDRASQTFVWLGSNYKRTIDPQSSREVPILFQVKQRDTAGY